MRRIVGCSSLIHPRTNAEHLCCETSRSSNFVRKVACKLLEEWSGTDYCLVLPWQPLESREIRIKLIRSWPQLLINCCWGVWVTSGISCSCLLKEKEGPHPPLDEKGHIFTSTSWRILWHSGERRPASQDKLPHTTTVHSQEREEGEAGVSLCFKHLPVSADFIK